MKLPSGVNLEVQDLGQYDVGAPGEIARAKSRASAAWNDMFVTAANAMQDVHDAHKEAEDYQRLQERVVQDSTRGQELSAYLENTNVIRLDDPDVPDLVRQHARAWARANKEPDGSVPMMVATHEIMADVMQGFYRNAASESLDALGGTRLKGNYIGAMSPQMASTAGNITQVQVKMRQEWLRARAGLLYDEAVNSGNETVARTLALQNVGNGVWLPEEGAERISELGSQMDNLEFDRRMGIAGSQADVDDASDFLDSPDNRMTPEQKSTGWKQIKSKTDDLLSDLQESTYQEGVARLALGQLDEAWIELQLSSGTLTGGMGAALLNAVRAPEPPVSNQRIVDNFRGMIGGLTMDVTEDFGVTERAQQIRLLLKQTYLGVDGSGNLMDERPLTGKDYQDLMQELDSEVDRALGGGRQQHQTAHKLMRTLTGYSDMFLKMEGTSPQREAFAAFELQFNEWSKLNPHGDPVAWVHANAERFAVEKFIGAHNQKLEARYPMYKSIMYTDIGEIDAARVIVQAKEDRDEDIITEDTFRMILRDFRYKLIGDEESQSSHTQAGE